MNKILFIKQTYKLVKLVNNITWNTLKVICRYTKISTIPTMYIITAITLRFVSAHRFRRLQLNTSLNSMFKTFICSGLTKGTCYGRLCPAFY